LVDDPAKTARASEGFYHKERPTGPEGQALRAAETLPVDRDGSVERHAIDRVAGRQRGCGHIERIAPDGEVKGRNARRQRRERRHPSRSADREDSAPTVSDIQRAVRPK